jgi:hypothetical protein
MIILPSSCFHPALELTVFRANTELPQGKDVYARKIGGGQLIYTSMVGRPYPTAFIDSNGHLDAGEELRMALSEEYSKSVNFSDGEIYLALRRYHHNTTKHATTWFAERRMWGRLTKDKRNDLKLILKLKPVVDAFDDLRHLPGLWPGFRIRRKSLLPHGCYEVRVLFLQLHIPNLLIY